METLFSLFSPSNLVQIGYPRTVFKSACQGDCKTPPTCLIWWSFGWDIQVLKCYHLSLTLNNSAKTSSYQTCFGILMTSRFQNCPWLTNLTKIWRRKQGKENVHFLMTSTICLSIQYARVIRLKVRNFTESKGLDNYFFPVWPWNVHFKSILK